MTSVFLRQSAGFGIIEVLVTLVILLTGLLGLAGLLTRSQQAEMESYQRAQALILLQDMTDRINANRKVAACYAITTDQTSGTPYLGTGYVGTPSCVSGTTEQNSLANADMTAWSNTLQGASEIKGGINVGAMIGARGCIKTIATDTYMIIVAWQGLGTSSAPLASLACANTLYGSDEARRRVVSTTFRIANLN
jgi:type IV pilus assembly protein PilV